MLLSLPLKNTWVTFLNLAMFDNLNFRRKEVLINREPVFVGVNPSSHFNPYRNQERIAKGHWENIIYGLTILKDATTGEITKFVNDKVMREVEETLGSTRNLLKDRKQSAKEKQTELRDKQLSTRTVQNWLKRLEVKGLVSKTRHNVYSLTPEGRNEKIFGEYYGMVIYDRLMVMPFKGSDEEKLLEYVKRLGIYITYIFIRNSARSGVQSPHTTIRKDDDEWLNDSISPVLLLEWFNNVFYSKSKSQNYDKLIKSLNTHFSEYIMNLEESERIYYEKVFPFLHRKRIEGLKRRKKNLNYS